MGKTFRLCQILRLCLIIIVNIKWQKDGYNSGKLIEQKVVVELRLMPKCYGLVHRNRAGKPAALGFMDCVQTSNIFVLVQKRLINRIIRVFIQLGHYHSSPSFTSVYFSIHLLPCYVLFTSVLPNCRSRSFSCLVTLFTSPPSNPPASAQQALWVEPAVRSHSSAFSPSPQHPQAPCSS